MKTNTRLFFVFFLFILFNILLITSVQAESVSLSNSVVKRDDATSHTIVYWSGFISPTTKVQIFLGESSAPYKPVDNDAPGSGSQDLKGFSATDFILSGDYNVRVFDTSGNYGRRNFILDYHPPAPTLSSPSLGSSYYQGQSVNFSWSGPSGYDINRYYLRIVRGTNFDATPVYDDEPSSSNRTVTIGTTWTPGTYTWGVRAIKDCPNTSVASQSTYEIAIGWGPYSTRTFTVLEAKPDLVVENAAVSTTNVTLGSSTTASCRVSNIGAGSAAASTLRYYISSNSTWDSSDLYSNSDSVNSLSSGGYNSQSATISIPIDSSVGTRYVLFYADKDYDVSESNENNNVAYQQIYVPTPVFDVTFPSVGATLYKGKEYLIKWSASNYVGNVQVHVYKPDGTTATIASSEPAANGSTGLSFNPPVEDPAWPSGQYEIGMSATVDGRFANFSGEFTITEPDPDLNVTFPTADATLEKEKDYYIKWSSNGEYTGTVKIHAYKDGESTPFATIATNTPIADGSTGVYFRVSDSDPNWPNGDRYNIGISTNGDNEFFDYSGEFTITDPYIDPELELTFPTTGATLTKGQDYLIKWTSNPAYSGTVKIHVYLNGDYSEPYRPVVTNEPIENGSDGVIFNVPLDNPDWPASSQYDIGTSTNDELDNDFSGYFSVVEPGELPQAPHYVPLYRLYKYDQYSNTRDHFYTTSASEKDNALNNLGYVYEGIECQISSKYFPGSLPLFRLYKSATNSHFYTSDSTEKDEMVGDGYVYENTQGYIHDGSQAGMVSLHRLRQPSGTPDHYCLMTSKKEYDNALSSGYIEDHTNGIGYVIPEGVRDPILHSRPQANFGGVDLASGAYRGLNHHSFTMKGRGPSLSFRHYYNSFNFNPDYPMGMGWSHNLDVTLIEDPLGNVLIKWGNGAVSFFEKTGDGVSDYEDKTGNHDQLTFYDQSGGVRNFNLLRKDQTQFQFNGFSVSPPPGSDSECIYYSKIVLTKITDWAGNELIIENEASHGTPIEVRDSVGRKLTLEYYLSPRLLKEVTEYDGDGTEQRSIVFTYDSDDLLATYTDAEGGITRYAYYDEPETLRHKLLKSITYPKGNTVEIDYDQATGQVSSVKDATATYSSGITYTPADGQTKVTDPVNDTENRVFNYIHDGEGRLARFKADTDVDWNIIERTDTNNPNLPTRLEDREGRSISFAYDANGNLLRTTNARGWVADYTYNPKNRLQTSTSFHASTVTNPPKTTYTYDTDDNRLRSIAAPEQGLVELFYDATYQGQLLRVEDGLNHSTLFAYDDYGNLNRVEDAVGGITQFTNDYAGRTLTTIDAEGIKTAFSYNNIDRPEDITNYNKDGLTALRTIVRHYDANGNLDDVGWDNDGTNSLTDYSYDSRDRLESVTTPAGFNRLFTYYDNDLPQTIRDCNGITATLVYDENNRLKEKNYTDSSQNVDYEYFANGKLKKAYRANNTALTTSFTYNNLNLVETVTDRYGKTVSYAYDNGGRLTDIDYPGGFDVSYTYDTADRLKTVSAEGSLLATYFYDAAGNLQYVDRGNALETWYSYDNASRLTGISEKNSSGSTLWSYSYELDHVGNHESITAANEPLEFVPQSEDISYVNDKASNRLQSAGATTFTYNNNGCRKTSVTGGVTTSYSWDNENRLTAVSNRNLTYTYDAFGNRVARSENGQTTRYVLNLNGAMSQVLAETDASGNETAYYVYGLGLLTRVDADNTSVRHYYHFNHRGDTIGLSDTSGNFTDYYAYDEYGQVQEDSNNSLNQPFKFVGQYGVMDEGQGLYFMRARYYDAVVGRFLSEDPLGFEGGDWNLFAYVGGRPLVGVDPNGLEENPLWYQMTNWVDPLVDYVADIPEEIGNGLGRYREYTKGHELFVYDNFGNIIRNPNFCLSELPLKVSNEEICLNVGDEYDMANVAIENIYNIFYDTITNANTPTNTRLIDGGKALFYESTDFYGNAIYNILYK